MNEHERANAGAADPVATDEKEVMDLIGRAGPRPAIPPEDFAVIRAAAREEWQDLVASGTPSRWAWRRPVLALAAGLAVAFLAGWWWIANPPPSVNTALADVELVQGTAWIVADGASRQTELAVGSALAAGARIETAGREPSPPARVALRLAGGQSVRLDRDTRVRLVTGRRLELERGAVYFDSGATPPASAVEIGTAYGTLRDVGTQFEVRLDSDAGALTVRVREGAVSLDREGDSHVAVDGEELALRRDGSVRRGAIEPYGSVWAWVVETAPHFDLEGLKVDAALRLLTREIGWQLRYEDEAVTATAAAADVFAGEATVGMTPEAAVEVVLAGATLGSRVEEGALVVTRLPR